MPPPDAPQRDLLQELLKAPVGNARDARNRLFEDFLEDYRTSTAREIPIAEQALSRLERQISSLPEGTRREINTILATAASTADRRRRWATEQRARVMAGADVCSSAQEAGRVIRQLQARLAQDGPPVLQRQNTMQCTRMPSNSKSLEAPLTPEQRRRISDIIERWDSNSAFRKLAEFPAGHPSRLIEKRGYVRPEFISRITTALEHIPEHLRILIEDAGYRIAPVDTITSQFPELKRYRPAGAPKGITFDDVTTVTNTELRIIVVPERIRDTNRDGNNLVQAQQTQALLGRQIGHLLDKILGGDYGRICNTRAFRAAYQRDLINIDVQDQERYTRCVQPGEGGRSETFAEVSSAIFGHTDGTLPAADTLKIFPNVAQLLRRLFDERK